MIIVIIMQITAIIMIITVIMEIIGKMRYIDKQTEMEIGEI